MMIDYWLDKLDFTVDRDKAIRCLKGYGAWDDLNEVEDRVLATLNSVDGLFVISRNILPTPDREGFDGYSDERPDDFDPPAGSDIFFA